MILDHINARSPAVEKCYAAIKALWHNPEQYLKCRYRCGITFADISSRVIHEASVHRGDLFPCRFNGCDSVLSTHQARYDHELKHQPEKWFRCGFDGCGKAFTRREVWINHERTHYPEKWLTCKHPGCGKMYANSGSLYRQSSENMSF